MKSNRSKRQKERSILLVCMFWKASGVFWRKSEGQWRRWLSEGAAGVTKWWAILLYHLTPSPPAAPLTAIWQQQTICTTEVDVSFQWSKTNGTVERSQLHWAEAERFICLHLLTLRGWSHVSVAQRLCWCLQGTRWTQKFNQMLCHFLGLKFGSNQLIMFEHCWYNIHVLGGFMITNTSGTGS